MHLEGNKIYEGQMYYQIDGMEAYLERYKEKGDKQLHGGLANIKLA